MFQLNIKKDVNTQLTKKDILAIADRRFLRSARVWIIVIFIVGFGLEVINAFLIKNKDFLTLAKIINVVNWIIGIAGIIWFFKSQSKNRKEFIAKIKENGNKLEYKEEVKSHE